MWTLETLWRFCIPVPVDGRYLLKLFQNVTGSSFLRHSIYISAISRWYFPSKISNIFDILENVMIFWDAGCVCRMSCGRLQQLGCSAHVDRAHLGNCSKMRSDVEAAYNDALKYRKSAKNCWGDLLCLEDAVVFTVTQNCPVSYLRSRTLLTNMLLAVWVSVEFEPYFYSRVIGFSGISLTCIHAVSH